MDFLWSPWRFKYVSSVELPGQCVFCQAPQRGDEEGLVLYRGQENFVIMNLFPYTTGHLMIAPYEHLASLIDAPKSMTDELMDLAKWSQRLLQRIYHPHGFNLGMNLGRAAGAGIEEHFHFHVVPRWFGDVNFTTVIGETRVLPEDLPTTYEKLRAVFREEFDPQPAT